MCRAFLRDSSGDDESAATLRQQRHSEHMIAAATIIVTAAAVASCLKGFWSTYQSLGQRCLQPGKDESQLQLYTHLT